MKRKELLNILSLRLWLVSDLAATVVNGPPASGIQCPLHQNYELASNVEKMDISNKLHIYLMWEICKVLDLHLDLKLEIKLNLQVSSSWSLFVLFSKLKIA